VKTKYGPGWSRLYKPTLLFYFAKIHITHPALIIQNEIHNQTKKKATH